MRLTQVRQYFGILELLRRKEYELDFLLLQVLEGFLAFALSQGGINYRGRADVLLGDRGRLVALQAIGLPIQRSWYLLHRADRAPSPATERIRAAIAGLGGSFLPRLEGRG